MKKAILVDLHNTILDKKERPIKSMVELLNTLAKDYAIIVISGRYVPTVNNKEDQLLQLEKSKVLYEAYLFNNDTFDLGGLDPNSKEDEPKVKAKMVKYIMERHPEFNIQFAIDNNKKCLKQYLELGINGLRPKFK